MSREIFDLPPYSEIWKDTKKRTPLSKERELLREIMGYIASGVVSITSNDLGDAAETLHEIQELLAQPEQTEQEPEAWMLIDKETGARIPKAYKPEHGVNKDRWELYPLFTRPQKCKFLSVKQVKDLWETTFKSAVPYYTFYEICVAIITALE
jgi:hypothetical protein